MQSKPQPSPLPLISCLMVTREGRLEQIRQSISCFRRQLLRNIELVIVHDSGNAFHDQLLETIGEEAGPDPSIRVHIEAPGHSLGWLRNRSLEHAAAELVCQWDDDDYNHPERLMIQYDLLQTENSDFCFMTDQLHLYTDKKFLFWDDWSRRDRPYDLIENTLLGKRDLMGSYADLPRGEDTAIIHHVTGNNYRVSRLSGAGWLYIYVYNGMNTWDFAHHSSISMAYRLDAERLAPYQERLAIELGKYDLPFSEVYMPHETGRIVIRPGGPG